MCVNHPGWFGPILITGYNAGVSVSTVSLHCIAPLLFTHLPKAATSGGSTGGQCSDRDGGL